MNDVNNELIEDSKEDHENEPSQIDIHFIDDEMKEKIFIKNEFQSFLSNTSKIVNRALHIGEKYDIFKDNRIDTLTTMSVYMLLIINFYY